MKIIPNIDVRTNEELSLNVNPIQAGGRLTPEARKALIAYADGYSVCDYCLKPFRLDYIDKPPIAEFYRQLAQFVNMATVRVLPGARRGFQVVANSLLNEDDIVLVSSLCHYSLVLAIEATGATWVEIPVNSQNKITADAVESRILQTQEKTGKTPRLIAVSHVDYQLGNEHDVIGVAGVAHSFGIPFLYNGAYTVGIMPVDGTSIGADFVVGSGHKSMASPAPTGILATNDRYAELIFRTTRSQGDFTGRTFGIKEVELLGCTVMGAPLIAMMASFPKVRSRVANWDDEVTKSNWFVSQMLRIEGTQVVSEMPRRHTLTKMDTSESFGRVAKTHRKKGYFLYEELAARRISGILRGATRQWKLNTYGLSWKQIEYLADSFLDIAHENGLEVR